MRSLLGGRDICVVMPTGGGKSLCYQLPGAMLPGKTVIVVSPLIALMQDQVAQLDQMGIPSALLNSSLAVGRQAEVIRSARAGEYRLLYLSPERLARQETLEWLRTIPISFFAIDEAHCISEWGHEFRPDYRQLSRLRVHFPDCPIAAFTASATKRVRHDIIQQLQLRDPHKYIASFHRPNLRYVVKTCDGRSQPDLLVSALRSYEEGNIIVYAPTIAKVEATVDLLQGQGIPAIAYHGQMEAGERRRNQERWMSDEVRVLVGTIAFGLGINKAAVRAVIHLSLPKSIEQYYQEAGRAGRDGLPADCVLLWQKRDAGLLAHFIEQINDPAEKQRAWQRYHEIRGFVESKRCRHLQICRHFGETPKWKTCAACDVCGSQPDWVSAREETVPPKKSPLQIAESGTAACPDQIDAADSCRSPRERASPRESGIASDIDPDLREYLREWRRETAKRHNTPAFVVLHDTTLDEICQNPSAIHCGSSSDFWNRRSQGGVVRPTDSCSSGAIPERRARRGYASRTSRAPPPRPCVCLPRAHTFDEIAKNSRPPEIDNCQYGFGPCRTRRSGISGSVGGAKKTGTDRSGLRTARPRTPRAA